MFLYSSKMCISFISLHNVHTTSSFLKNEHTISFASCGVCQIHQCAYQFINSFKMCIQVLSFLQNVHTSSFIPLKYMQTSPFINANKICIACLSLMQNVFTRSFFTLRCAYQFFQNVHISSFINAKCAYHSLILPKCVY